MGGGVRGAAVRTGHGRPVDAKTGIKLIGLRRKQPTGMIRRPTDLQPALADGKIDRDGRAGNRPHTDWRGIGTFATAVGRADDIIIIGSVNDLRIHESGVGDTGGNHGVRPGVGDRALDVVAHREIGAGRPTQLHMVKPADLLRVHQLVKFRGLGHIHGQADLVGS